MGFYTEKTTNYTNCTPLDGCREELKSNCMVYTGDDLICTDIKKGTKLTKVIEKLSVFICNILGILPLKADLVNGKVPVSQLPLFSSLNKSVITLPNFLSFPTVGEADVIYIAKSPKNIQYIWNGTIYEKISSNINSSDDVNQGVVNLYMTDVEKIKINSLNNFDNSGNILALNNKVDKNTPIISNTKTKISYDSKGLVTTGADATTADINDSTNRRYVTDADLIDINNLSGVNTGNQTNIVGITGTKAQYNTSLTDGDFLFVGDTTSYTDEQAQDAVGSTLTDTNTIDFTYNDTINTITADVKPDSIGAIQLSNTINISEFINDVNYESTTQLNNRDISNRNRINHTGTQLSTTISDFIVASKVAVVDNAIVDNITDKAPSQNAVFDALSLKYNASNPSGYITNSNLTYIASPTQGVVVSDVGNDAILPLADTINAGLISAQEKNKLAGLNNFDPTPINNQLANKADLVGGLVPSNQLPSFVDDVIEVANFVSLPITGEIGKIYIAISPKNLQYRWSGSSYIAITNGLIASTDDVPEGNNLYFTVLRFLQNLTFANIISGLGFTPENVANKSNTLTPSTTLYPNNNAVINAISNANLPVSSTQSGIVNNVSLQELGGVDKNINSVRVGRGSGNVNSNTSIGLGALLTNTTGGANTALGLNALNKNTTGGANVANGFQSLNSNTTGFGNTAIGNAPLVNNTIGNSNTAIGRSAGNGITTGSNNTYIGQGTSLGDTSDTIVLSAGTTNRIIVDNTGKTNLLGALTVSGNITATTNTGTPNEVVRNSDIVGLTTADATTTIKGIVKLAGDLGGTADLPTVPNKVDKIVNQGLISDAEKLRLSTVVNYDNSGNVTALNLKENLDNKSTDVETDKLSTIKYPSIKAIVDWINLRFQTALTSGTNIKTIEGQSVLGTGNIDLAKSDVGLANVDNTTDIGKPISTLTQNALNAKENISNKVSTLTASSTLYPNNDAVIAGLATKQNTITPQNVTAGSAKITLAGTPTGASLQPFSINVNEANFAVPQANVVGLTTSLVGKENTIVAGTTAQYRRGDNTWQTLDKNAVGLNLVDNTADVNKSVNSSRFITSLDGDRNADTKFPNQNSLSVKFDFVNSSSTGTGGLYAGLMTYVPYNGSLASTGGPSYQLAFGTTGLDSLGFPQLRLRKGLDLTWNQWYDIWTSANLPNPASTISPNFTGIPTAPTAPIGTNTTQIATTAFVANNAQNGTYTPVLSNLTNVNNASIPTATYTKVGNVVSVRISLFCNNTTANVNSNFNFTLPFNRQLISDINLGSVTGFQTGAPYFVGNVQANNLTTATASFNQSSNLNQSGLSIQLQYLAQ